MPNKQHVNIVENGENLHTTLPCWDSAPGLPSLAYLPPKAKAGRRARPSILVR